MYCSIKKSDNWKLFIPAKLKGSWFLISTFYTWTFTDPCKCLFIKPRILKVNTEDLNLNESNFWEFKQIWIPTNMRTHFETVHLTILYILMYLIFDRSLPKQQDRRKVQKVRSGSYVVFKDEISFSLYVLCNNIMARS